MRTHARSSRGGERGLAAVEEEHERTPAFELVTAEAEAEAEDAGDGFDDEAQDLDIFRVSCPDCARPIALLGDEDVLPEHALCPTPWNPFGLTVCPGSGRAAHDATPAADAADGDDESDIASLLTLPAGLDWRTQPFSHVGGAGSRPLRVPLQRAA